MQVKAALPYLKYTAVVVLFLLMITLYALEFPRFSNTFQVKYLIIMAVIMGAVVGAFLGFRYQHYAKDEVERFQIFAFFITLAIIFMPLVVSLSNRLLSFQPIQEEQVELFKIEPYISNRFGILKGETIQPDGYRIFFIRNGQLEQIKTTALLFVDKTRGDTIQIPVLKGLWGFEIVLL